MSERAIRVWSLFLTKNPKQKTQLFRVALQAGPRQDQEGGLGRSETVVVSLKENTSKSEHLDYVLKTDSSGQIKAPRRTVLEMFLL